MKQAERAIINRKKWNERVEELKRHLAGEELRVTLIKERRTRLIGEEMDEQKNLNDASKKLRNIKWMIRLFICVLVLLLVVMIVLLMYREWLWVLWG